MVSHQNKKIPVVVVESHQHVCEHIHHVLRQKKVLDQPWLMVHYDAHPDLSCPHPTIPAAACFRPRKRWKAASARTTETTETLDDSDNDGDIGRKDLYDFLDSTATGIAEWILPLVLAANLRRVYWIHPTQSVEQLPAGDHRYNVGAWMINDPEQQQSKSVFGFLDLPSEAIVKVDWDCSYYQDDDSVVPTDELLLAQPLHLTVSEELSDSTKTNSQRQHVVLDVCLDYFACLNPFVTDLEKFDIDVANAFVQVVHQSTFFGNTSDTAAAVRAEQLRCDRRAVQTFRRLLMELVVVRLLRDADDDDGHDEYDSQSRQQSSGCDGVLDSLAVDYYYDESHGKQLLQHFRDCLDRTASDPKHLSVLIEQALPNMTMPHNSTTTPDEPTILRRFQAGLPAEDPLLISIARSSIDGFTPSHRVEDLQQTILQIVHDRYCGCPQDPNMTASAAATSTASESSSSSTTCWLHVVRDYGLWEGSTLWDT